MGKYDQAVAYARQAGETYRDFGNQRKWLVAIEYEAVAFYSAKNYKAALELWRSMEELVGIVTPEHKADRLHNIGLCVSALGDFEEAARRLAAAVEEFERIGHVVNRVKCLYSLGLAIHETGRHNDAVPVLAKAQEELDGLGMESEAALAALVRVEALLAAGRTGEVPAICRMLIDRFTREGNNAAAMTALAYLRETVASGHATPLSVRQVRDFIRDTTMKRLDG